MPLPVTVITGLSPIVSIVKLPDASVVVALSPDVTMIPLASPVPHVPGARRSFATQTRPEMRSDAVPAGGGGVLCGWIGYSPSSPVAHATSGTNIK
jgi:hypothetical protein